MSTCNNHSAYFFCGHDNSLGGQFWTIGSLNLLGGQNNLLGGQLPTQVTFYLPPWLHWVTCRPRQKLRVHFLAAALCHARTMCILYYESVGLT